MKLDLDGQTVTKVSELFPLTFYTDGGWYLRIESTFTVADPGAEPLSFEGDDPETPAALTPLLTGQTLRAGEIIGGSLRLAFTDGRTVQADADPDYEAWSTISPSGQRVICMPGGELAIWD